MTAIVKYGITPKESAKSEVTMRISVKNWSKKVVSRILGVVFGYVGYVGYVGYIRISVTKLT